MNDFTTFEKTIVRELSCRLCLCTDVMKLKPLSSEIKRKIKKLFDVSVRADDSLPKAICHDCLQQVGALHHYMVKVEKTQKFLAFHKMKTKDERREKENSTENKMHAIVAVSSAKNKIQTSVSHNNLAEPIKKQKTATSKTPPDHQQGDAKQQKQKSPKKTVEDMKFMESFSLDEFAKTEKVKKFLLNSISTTSTTCKSPNPQIPASPKNEHQKKVSNKSKELLKCTTDSDVIDPIVIVDGRPAKQGAELDRQISLFYKMECCICHATGFHFRSLMKHYKERHGVPGYVTCCNKKFHYFYPKKIIEHMAYHLQPNIFMCKSCHKSFQTSQELIEHQSNGGRSEGKIICPRCSERYPTYRELSEHIVTHRSDKLQCDYCGKILKQHHRKKTVNHMENVILCSQCRRTLISIEKHEKEIKLFNKDKAKPKNIDIQALQKQQKFQQALGLSGDEFGSTD